MTTDIRMSPPPRREVTAALTSLLEEETEKLFGVVDMPPVPEGQLAPDLPYGIVYPINDGEYWGGLGGPESSGEFTFQVTVVGGRADQCEWLGDRVRTAVLGRTTAGAFNTELALTTPYVVVARKSLSGPGNMIRSDLLWSQSETFCLYVGSA
jgi:hypothetical protein